MARLTLAGGAETVEQVRRPGVPADRDVRRQGRRSTYVLVLEEDAFVPAEELAARGANKSLIHIDWMIGSAEIDVDGLTADGGSEPLMRNGDWVS